MCYCFFTFLHCIWLCFVFVFISIKQHDRYGQLILQNSTAADTGEYSCWLLACTSYSCKKDESRTGSTYIFFAGNMMESKF